MYYFREVVPWQPSFFADRRDTWVKFYGIPLHIWGENLFKSIGSKYGEFLDFDSNTASRAKLDVALLKISTKFRESIDESVQVKALGVVYTIRVVEEKVVDQGFYHGERLHEPEWSWVESVNCHNDAIDVEDGGNGGLVCEEAEEDDVDFPSCQHHEHVGYSQVDGDVSKDLEGMSQNIPLVSGGLVVVPIGNKVQSGIEELKCVEEVLRNDGTQCEKVDIGDRAVECNGVLVSPIQTCQMGERETDQGGPEVCVGLINVDPVRSPEPSENVNPVRSFSLPPNRSGGPAVILGRESPNGPDVNDFNDSISLIEERRRAIMIEDKLLTSAVQADGNLRRGRSRKRKGRGRPKNSSNIGVPKFIQLAEVVKDGGGNQRRKKKDVMEVNDSCGAAVDGGADSSRSTCDVALDVSVPDSLEGLQLEVVLPLIAPTPNSGVGLFLGDDDLQRSQHLNPVVAESSKLLQIQQKVGFGFNESDDEIIKVLVEDELRDREKKQVWEQREGF
jgi:hypothetical protein